jgi:hypothetical protein
MTRTNTGLKWLITALTFVGCGKVNDGYYGYEYKPNDVVRIHNTTKFFVDASTNPGDIPSNITLYDGTNLLAQYKMNQNGDVNMTYSMYVNDTLPDPNANSRAFKMDAANYIQMRHNVADRKAADTVDIYKAGPGSSLQFNVHDVTAIKALHYLDQAGKTASFRIQ